MEAGEALPVVTKEVTQEKIRRYAEASGDFNPLHLDAAFAASTQFGGTIAHGMMSLAYIWEMMALQFGDAWNRGGRLKVRFRAPVFPSDLVSASGAVKGVEEVSGAKLLRCAVECRNQRGEQVITGDGWVPL